MKQILTLALVVLFQLFSFAQSKKYTVKGLVVDADQQPLIGATVVFLSAKDSVMQSFGVTDIDGKFNISKVRPGQAIVQITYVGYGTFEKQTLIEGDDKELDLGTTILYTNNNLMDAIEIKAEYIPIVVKKDTVEYNADAFKVRPNANVEELLKKLPGVEVDTDGTITAHGEQVNTVTVDGKKFFGDDPKMATQNLPADAIKKVQIIDKKSDRAVFSGISDGETEKTINLELKEDKKIGFFGDVKAGYGTDQRYESKLSLNKFGAKYQAATLISYNNINQQGFSFSDYNTLVGGFRSNRSGNSAISNGNSDGNTTSLSGGLNLSYDFTKKSKITTSYFVSYIDKLATVAKNQEYYLPSRNFFETRNSNSSDNSLAHNINLDIELSPDSLYRIDINAKYNQSGTDQTNMLIQDALTFNQELITSSDQAEEGIANKADLSFGTELSRRMGKPGRIVTMKASYGKTDTNDDYLIDRTSTEFKADTTLTTLLFQNQLSYLDNNNYAASLSYTEPLGNKNYLSTTYVRSNYNYDNIKDFYDLDENLVTPEVFNAALSTFTNNEIQYDKLGLGYTRDRAKYNLNADLYYQHSQLKAISQNQNPLDRGFNFLLPSMSLNLIDQHVVINYRTSVKEPSSSQLQAITDNSDPNNIIVGNPKLDPEYAHTLSSRFHFFDSYNFRSMFASLSYTYTLNDIVVSKITDASLRSTSTYENVDNQKRLSASLHYGTPIRPLHIKGRMSIGANYSNSIAYINGQQNNVISNSPDVRLELENLDNDVVSLMVNGRLRYNQNKYSNNEDRNSDFITQEYGSVLIVNFGKGFSIDSDLKYLIYSKEQFGDNNKFAVLNAGFSKSLLKDRLTAKLYTFDILNQNRGINRSLTSTGVSETISNSLQQYTMLSLTYKLSAFSPASKGPIFMRH